ncbi:RNA polymerase RpoE-like sigma-24 subunit [Cytobacillus oceanisediminis]|uniref:RNA polymerase RpoE-like sigma-24 subunit n=1 Tax=Cytobacillus oceanisediminis TaxID=665099 RepID=A0A2V3ACB2_9BACI|nr:sigma-70 family RNA polymerase sigma factor [Cytobacillus oceanisediminis]PWW31174.1 RNA polymerase RpoE-like sigma-24 subunit [Cytobacillus oceanisediminis]
MKESRRDRLDDLYRHYARPLYYYLYKMSGSKETAEDLTQETFVRATVSLTFYQQEDVRAWLFKVARNAYLDEWRKRQRRKKIPFADYIFPMAEMTSPYGLPEDSAIKRETRKNVEDLLSCLPEQYRSILYLREFESFSYSEIEEALDLTENQVKVTLHRARKKLAQLADEQWREKND